MEKITLMKKKVIKNIKTYLKILSNREIDLAESSFAYLISWTKSVGYTKLKLLSGSKINLNLIIILLKCLVSRHSLNKAKVYKGNFLNKENLFISWSFKDNFKKGIYKDKYFGLTNKISKKFGWVLLSIDGYIPKKIPDNVMIIDLKKNSIFFSFFNTLKIFFLQLIKNNFSISKFSHYIFSDLNSSKIQIKKFENNININSIKKIIIPYEAQIFQKTLIKKIRQTNKNTKIYGYLHSSLPAIPSEYIYLKDLSPDKIFYHGKSYKKILTNHLSWPSKKLFFIKSLRYTKTKTNKIQPNIYLPYDFSIKNKNIFLEEFLNLSKKSKKYYLKNIKINLHPVFKNNKKHIDFREKINRIVSSTGANKIKKRIPIFLGSTTIFEGLEVYDEVIHICADNLFERFDSDFWPYLKVTNLSSRTFLIRLLKKGEYLQYGNNQNQKKFVELINL